MRRALTTLLLVLLPTLVHAEFIVCGTGAGLQRAFYADPTHNPGGACSLVPKTDTAAQVALIQSVGRYDYLKVVSGLVVEKTQGEKDAVDAAKAAQQALLADLHAELTSSATCNAGDLATVNSRLAIRKDTLDAQIDGIAAANLTTLKAGLHGVVDDEYVVLQALARCVIAILRLGR